MAPALLPALLVGACMVGPDFTPPQTSASAGYVAAGDAALPPDQHLVQHLVPNKTSEGAWWSEFHAPALDQVVTQALSDNQDVAVAKARLAEARESVTAATGALMPQLSVGANATETKYGPALFGPSDISIPPFMAYTAGPTVSFPTDLFGGGRRSVEQQAAIA